MLNCKWSEKAEQQLQLLWGQTNFKARQMRQMCCSRRQKEKETESKADKEREPLKVVSCLLGVFSAENFTVDPLRARRLIRTYKILYWFSLYARYLPLPLCECVCVFRCVSVCRKFFSTELLPHLSIGSPAPVAGLAPAFTAGVRLIYLPFLFRSLRFIFKHYS